MRLCILPVLAIVVIASHGGSLDDGLFLDDHLHKVAILQSGWRFQELLDMATIEPARFLDAWWQNKEVRWDYARPLSMAALKLMYTIWGDQTFYHHLLSLVLHYMCCLLVYRLCFWMTKNRFWSLVGGILFAIYPHSVFAVGWLAAQNVVLQTLLTLASLICYIHASGLTGQDSSIRPSQPPPVLRRSLVASLLLFVAALLSRENAIVLPVILIALDFAFGGPHWLRHRWRLHGVYFFIAAAFAIWRIWMFDSKLPDVYLRRPEDFTYVPWLVAKLFHYLACSLFFCPMVIGPTGRKNPFVEVPGDCLLSILIVMVLLWMYHRICRGRVTGYWIWPMWMVLAVLPVVPVFATPHSGYMTGVGWSIALTLVAARTIPQRRRLGAIATGVFSFLALFAFIQFRLAWVGVISAEQYTIAQVSAHDIPPDHADVFFINLPLANVYLPLDLQRTWHKSPETLKCHVLTYSPHILLGPRQCRIEQVDSHTFRLTLPDEEPYFAGLLGQFLLQALREKQLLNRGDVIAAREFRTTILETNARGVTQIEFAFDRPLADDKYRFFLITEECPGAQIRFSRQPALADIPETSSAKHDPVTIDDTIYCANASQWQQKREYFKKIMQFADLLTSTDLYLTGPPRSSPYNMKR